MNALRARGQESHEKVVVSVTGEVTHALKAEGADASEDGTGRGNPIVPVCFHHNAQVDQMDFDPHTSAPLTCSQQAAIGPVAIGFQDDTTPKASEERIGALRADAGGQGPCVAYDDRNQAVSDKTYHTLRTAGSRVADSVLTRMSVRRLTPMECERLQGFPPGHTQIPWKKKPTEECPDGPRYKALGNSMAVPVMRWIGQRIQAVSQQGGFSE